MIAWRQTIAAGTPIQVQAKDPSNNTYNSTDWFLYACGFNVPGIGHLYPYINSGYWYVYCWLPYGGSVDILAIPQGYFSNIFTSSFTQ